MMKHDHQHQHTSKTPRDTITIITHDHSHEHEEGMGIDAHDHSDILENPHNFHHAEYYEAAKYAMKHGSHWMVHQYSIGEDMYPPFDRDETSYPGWSKHFDYNRAHLCHLGTPMTPNEHREFHKRKR